jgi:two-component system phosphate regulon sensor histidine kinase PhoR
VKKAVSYKEEQYNNSIHIGLKSVVNQLLNNYNDSTLKMLQEQGEQCDFDRRSIYDVIDAKELKKLIQNEIGCYINLDHSEYAVFSQVNYSFAMGKYDKYKSEIMNSQHIVSLDCLFKSGKYQLAIYTPGQKNLILYRLLGWLLLSALFIIATIFSYYYTIVTLLRQKKLSEMKTDFVNNMTHEFKTPISTISLASEMLLKPNVYESAEKTKKYAGIIFDENVRLENQVEQVLQITILDKENTKIRPSTIDIHKIIQKLAENFKLSVKDRNGSLKTSFNAEDSVIEADRVHVVNMVSNLLDNAIKYSPDAPEIHIQTKNYKEGILVCVQDKGMGISHEFQKQIFKKLYRIPTGNLHDVKGFGLGLYYTKTMIEAHGGTIHVKSDIGKGSSFELYFPFNSLINYADEE